jgi:hypothetical protein
MKELRAIQASLVWALTLGTACGGSTGSDISGSTDAGSEAASSPDAGAGTGNVIGAIGSVAGSLPEAGTVAPGTDAGGGGVSPQVVDGCTQLCTKEQAANCPGFGSLSSCMVGCDLLLRNPTCASQVQGLFTCTESSTASCDAQGNPTFANCGVQYLGAASCALTNAVDTSLSSACTTYCDAVAAAKCPNDSDVNSCISTCGIVGNLFGCDPQWTQYVTCANGAMLSCGSDGKASAPACISQVATFYACAAAALVTNSSADGG